MKPIPPFHRLEVVDAVLDSVAVLIVDLESGQILYATRLAEEMFGYYARNELTSHLIEDLLPPELRADHIQQRDLFSRDMAGRPLAVRNVRGLRNDGQELQLSAFVSRAMISDRRCGVATLLDASRKEAQHILLVEDNQTTLLALEMGLRSEGMTVSTALDATRAQEILESQTDIGTIVLDLDLGLPGMDGLDFLRRLRSNPRFARIPVLLATAASDADIQPILADRIALGPLGVIRKPFFDMHDVAVAIRVVHGGK